MLASTRTWAFERKYRQGPYRIVAVQAEDRKIRVSLIAALDGHDAGPTRFQDLVCPDSNTATAINHKLCKARDVGHAILIEFGVRDQSRFSDDVGKEPDWALNCHREPEWALSCHRAPRMEEVS